jgi:ABC-type branched-subunit amino acid transport system ATPase component
MEEKTIQNPILDLSSVTMKFGGLTAVNNVSLKVFPRDLVAIIGPNGAGKTTLFNTVTGIYTPTSGSVRFCQKDLERFKIFDFLKIYPSSIISSSPNTHVFNTVFGQEFLEIKNLFKKKKKLKKSV